MAKKTTIASKNAAPVAAKAPVAAPTVTAIRNSAVPPRASTAAAIKSAPTRDQIALAAYFIWKSGKGGSQEENWFRAEREVRRILSELKSHDRRAGVNDDPGPALPLRFGRCSGPAYNTGMAERTDESDLSAVPLFPLPNVVLFPHAVLPLHIFEERYKTMTADALRGSRQIAMALLRPGWEKCYHAKPAIEPVVCVGTILSHERLSDGRYNFLLQGTMRAQIRREVGDRAYRRAELEPLVEVPVDDAQLIDDRRRLAMAFQDPRLRCTGIGRRFHQMLDGSISTNVISDLVAFNFLDHVPLKQSLLADCDVRRRVSRVVEAFESIYSHLQPNLN